MGDNWTLMLQPKYIPISTMIKYKFILINPIIIYPSNKNTHKIKFCFFFSEK